MLAERLASILPPGEFRLAPHGSRLSRNSLVYGPILPTGICLNPNEKAGDSGWRRKSCSCRFTKRGSTSTRLFSNSRFKADTYLTLQTVINAMGFAADGKAVCWPPHYRRNVLSALAHKNGAVPPKPAPERTGVRPSSLSCRLRAIWPA